jgi:hypothetical protein
MTMKKLLFLAILGLASACGTSGGSLSCDFTTSQGDHGCTDYSWSGGDYTSTYNNLLTACGVQMKGQKVDICSHTGSFGACRQTATANGATITADTWIYVGTPDSAMMTCKITNTSYIAP